MEVYFKIVIAMAEVVVHHFEDCIQLGTNIVKQLHIWASRVVAIILHLGRGMLQQSCGNCVLVLEFLDMCKNNLYLLLEWMHLGLYRLKLDVSWQGAQTPCRCFPFRLL